MTHKEILGAASAVLMIGSYLPYFGCMIKGYARPHIFTWVIWVLLTGTAFAVQVYKGEGAGSWLMCASCLCCLTVALLAIRHGEKDIIRSDWCSFIFALSAIPLWLVTKDPTWSVILISATDAVGFFPTYRKSWHKPFDESALFFLAGAICCVLSVMALDRITMNTALYTFSVMFFNMVFVLLLLYRRQYVSRVTD